MDRKYVIKEISTKEPEMWMMIADDMCTELREIDKKEILTFSECVWDGIYESLAWSDECWQALDDKGNPLAIWGIRQMEGRRGRLIWCLCTDRIWKYWRPFSRESRKIVSRWADKYGLLYNAVSESNKEAIRWLKWCGAEISRPFTVGNTKFLHFWIQRTILGQRKDESNVQHRSGADGTERIHAVPTTATAGGRTSGGIQSTGSGLQGAGGSPGTECEGRTPEAGIDC